jgi:hypothetical protein
MNGGTNAPDRERHVIPAIGLSFEVEAGRAVETYPLEGGTIVSQRLPGDAVVFVRFGAGETLDRFLAGLGDALSEATTLADEAVTIAGRPARRVTVSLHRKGKQIPSRPTTVPSLIRVIGFAAGDVPVLVGYRVREDAGDEVRAAAERMVQSVAINLP